MSRETKHERIVRGIYDQVLEHLHELKIISSNPTSKEVDVERWCQSLMRNCLGFTATNGYSIRAQESRGKFRPDLTLIKNDKPICVVEIKRLGFDLNKSDFRSGKTQLGEYLTSIGGVTWGILTNGSEWRLFDFSNPAVGGIEVVSFDVRDEGEGIDTSKRGVEEVCWNFLDLHESSFVSGVWNQYSKEATAFSPESLARAILASDTIKHIAKAIRGEHDYRANSEVLLDHVFSLLTKGLDDSVAGWNETKEAELTKYISAQKRASRRKRSLPKKDDKASVSPSTAEVESAASSEAAVVNGTVVDSSKAVA